MENILGDLTTMLDQINPSLQEITFLGSEITAQYKKHLSTFSFMTVTFSLKASSGACGFPEKTN